MAILTATSPPFSSQLHTSCRAWIQHWVRIAIASSLSCRKNSWLLYALVACLRYSPKLNTAIKGNNSLVQMYKKIFIFSNNFIYMTTTKIKCYVLNLWTGVRSFDSVSFILHQIFLGTYIYTHSHVIWLLLWNVDISTLDVTNSLINHFLILLGLAYLRNAIFTSIYMEGIVNKILIFSIYQSRIISTYQSCFDKTTNKVNELNDYRSCCNLLLWHYSSLAYCNLLDFI